MCWTVQGPSCDTDRSTDVGGRKSVSYSSDPWVVFPPDFTRYYRLGTGSRKMEILRDGVTVLSIVSPTNSS